MSSAALYAMRVYQQSFAARPCTTLAFTNGTLGAVGDALAQAATIFSSRSLAEDDERERYHPIRTARFFAFGFVLGPIIGRWIKFLEHKFPLPSSAHALASVPHGAPSPLSPPPGTFSASLPTGPTGMRTTSRSSWCRATPDSGTGTGTGTGAGVPSRICVSRCSAAHSGLRNVAAAAAVTAAAAARSYWLNNRAAVSFLALAKRVAADQLIMAPAGLAMFIGAMSLMEGRDWAHTRRKYADMFPSALMANWQVWPIVQMINFGFMPLVYRVPFQSTCGIFWNLYLSLLNAHESKKEK